MTLNPFKLLEQLINEHGSSAILKERLDLAVQQYALLEKQNADKDIRLAAKDTTISQLQADKEQLQIHDDQKQREIDRLTKQIQDTYEKDHGRKPQQVAILQMLHPEHGTPLKTIATKLGISEKSTVFHLQSLSFDSLAYSDNFPNDPIWDTGATVAQSTWIIRHPGLEYLANNGLLT